MSSREFFVLLSLINTHAEMLFRIELVYSEDLDSAQEAREVKCDTPISVKVPKPDSQIFVVVSYDTESACGFSFLNIQVTHLKIIITTKRIYKQKIALN